MGGALTFLSCRGPPRTRLKCWRIFPFAATDGSNEEPLFRSGNSRRAQTFPALRTNGINRQMVAAFQLSYRLECGLRSDPASCTFETAGKRLKLARVAVCHSTNKKTSQGHVFQGRRVWSLDDGDFARAPGRRWAPWRWLIDSRAGLDSGSDTSVGSARRIERRWSTDHGRASLRSAGGTRGRAAH